MAIVKWNPGRDLVRAQDEFSRLFDSFFGYDDREWPGGSWLLATDISENDNAIELKAELPGLKKEDIKVTVHENILTIEGEKKVDQKDKKKEYYYTERLAGSFKRAFVLPKYVKADKLKAEYADGVLTVTIPKAEEAKPREIAIQ